jgi:hypothetical protein
MSRLGTIVFAIFGGIFGALWAVLTAGDLVSVIVGALIGTALLGVISYSWELREIG